jgi:hypothetical protein
LSSLGRPEAPLTLQVMATTWLPTNEIDTCKGDLVVIITEVIAGNTISTDNHLISPKDLFGLNPKQLEKKLWEKRWVPCGGGDGGEEQELQQAAWRGGSGICEKVCVFLKHFPLDHLKVVDKFSI